MVLHGRVLLGGAALAAGNSPSANPAQTDAARAEQVARDLQYKSIIVNQISALSATDDGAVWAVTSGGTLLHCLFDKAQERVRCYDRNGPAKPEY